MAGPFTIFARYHAHDVKLVSLSGTTFEVDGSMKKASYLSLDITSTYFTILTSLDVPTLYLIQDSFLVNSVC